MAAVLFVQPLFVDKGRKIWYDIYTLCSLSRICYIICTGKGSEDMYYSLLVILLTLLTVFLLILYRKLDKSKGGQNACGYTVIPLAGYVEPVSIERLVRACFWENTFGGGMKRDILLVSCGCGELDELGRRLVSELEGVKIVKAEELAEFMVCGQEFA